MTASTAPMSDAPFWRGASLGVALSGLGLALLIAHQATPTAVREVSAASGVSVQVPSPTERTEQAERAEQVLARAPAMAGVGEEPPTLAEDLPKALGQDALASPEERRDASTAAEKRAAAGDAPDTLAAVTPQPVAPEALATRPPAMTMPPPDAFAQGPSANTPATPTQDAQASTSMAVRERYGSLSDAMLAEALPVPPSDPDPSIPSGDGWIDIWQPFASPVSAQGFADRLETLTGFEYRVARRSTDGLHQVSVRRLQGYAPGQMLGQIAERSGLAVVSP